jgi:alpha-beta hydrolase superfamily lysophospholipase
MRIVSGDADPAAQGGSAIERLASRYREAGLRDDDVRLYPGACHEILKRDQPRRVTVDIIAFLLDRSIGAS